MDEITPGQIERAMAAAGPDERLLRRRLLEVLTTPAGPPRMTYEEFLEWADEDTLAEWVEGEVIMTSPASDRHQDISDFLTSILRVYAETHRLGVVRSAPFQMRLQTSGREPDLMFIAAYRLDRLRPTFLDGPADLVVEIISLESVGRDRGEKYYEYARGGVAEYWLIDPDTQLAEFYQLDSTGHYRLVPPDGEGVYRSLVLPGFWLHVHWLWQQPLPPILEIARRLDLL